MRPLAIGLLMLAVAGFVPAEVGSRPHPELLYTVARRYEPLAWVEGEERFSAGASIFIQDASGRRRLLPSFAASADPTVSFDGKNVLFSGKLAVGEAWQIWEMPLEGGDPRRITNCKDDCVRPLYLPEDRIVYGERVGKRFVIQTVDISGGKLLPLTYGVESSLPTDVLRDGRVLFESASPFGSAPEIFTVYTDGSGVESYRCDHGTARHSGKQVASGDIVFAAQSGLARFTSALAKQVDISVPAGDYAGDIAETLSGEWLLAWRRDQNSLYQLMKWSPGKNTALRPAVKEQGSNVLEPVLITERIPPNRHPSGLHDWPNANLLCLNAYTSKYKFAASSIQSVRLYTRDAAGNVQLLGSAPVEADGSFFVQVTGDQPMQIELLNGRGETLKREAGWFWLRRGEQRACVGCHAGSETAPENAVPMILLRSTTPADLTHAASQASAGGH